MFVCVSVFVCVCTMIIGSYTPQIWLTVSLETAGIHSSMSHSSRMPEEVIPTSKHPLRQLYSMAT